MQKNPQTREDNFWIFMDFHAGPESNLHPYRLISSMTSLTPKPSIHDGHIIPSVTVMLPATQVFSSETCEIFKNTYLEEHLRRTASIGGSLLPTFFLFSGYLYFLTTCGL